MTGEDSDIPAKRAAELDFEDGAANADFKSDISPLKSKKSIKASGVLARR
jgi:hypothetical protein